MGKCYNSTYINAPVDRVWRLVRNFHDMSWATGPIETCVPVGETQSDQLGARRVLNGAIQETLVGLDDRRGIFTYQITEGPSPISSAEVKDYHGVVRVRQETSGGGTFVEWTSTWIGRDGEVGEFCNPIYTALLAALKQAAENTSGNR